MADEQKFKIVFSGQFAPQIGQSEALRNLAALYKTDTETIAKYFSGPDTVVKKDLNRSAAEQYSSVLNKAGALCRVVAMSEALTLDKKPASRLPAFIEYSLGVAEIRYTPFPINRISQSDGGININRADKKHVPFQDIILLSVYEHSDTHESQMVLFLDGSKQPFICDCFKIAYSEYFEVKGVSMRESLRRFVQLLKAHNPRLLFDRRTYDFVNGGKLPEFNGDEVRLTSALSRALAQIDLTASLAEEPPPPPVKVNLQKQAESETTAPVVSVTPVVFEKEPPVIRPVCPKCGEAYDEGRLECQHCGIVFAKWFQRKQQEQLTEQAEDEAIELDEEWELDELDLWQRHGLKWYAYLLIGGFALPLLKHSILHGSSVLIWPWNLMGFGIDAAKAAAMATVSSPDYMFIWSLLPLAVAAALLGAGRFLGLNALSIAMCLSGTVSMASYLAVFYKEGEVFGMMFSPPTTAGGIMVMLTVISGILVVGANHLRKRFVELKLIRWLSGIGGTVMVAFMVLQMLAAERGWDAWSMMLLYLLMAGFGLFALFAAFLSEPDRDLLEKISILARTILCWAPLACFIAQNWSSDAYTGYVITGGGGFMNILVSVVKSFLIYYGFSFMAAMGFTVFLEQLLLRKEVQSSEG